MQDPAENLIILAKRHIPMNLLTSQAGAFSSSLESSRILLDGCTANKIAFETPMGSESAYSCWVMSVTVDVLACQNL